MQRLVNSNRFYAGSNISHCPGSYHRLCISGNRHIVHGPIGICRSRQIKNNEQGPRHCRRINHWLFRLPGRPAISRLRSTGIKPAMVIRHHRNFRRSYSMDGIQTKYIAQSINSKYPTSCARLKRMLNPARRLQRHCISAFKKKKAGHQMPALQNKKNKIL